MDHRTAVSAALDSLVRLFPAERQRQAARAFGVIWDNSMAELDNLLDDDKEKRLASAALEFFQQIQYP